MNPTQLAKMQAGRQKPKVAKTPVELTDMQRKDLRKVQEYYPMALETFRKAYSGRFRTSAIKAKCLECTCLQYVEVRDCTISGCPLWPYRPYQHKH